MPNRTWWQGRAATLSWLVALVAGLLVAAAYPAALPPRRVEDPGRRGRAALPGRRHGRPGRPADLQPARSPLRPSCFGPAQIRAAYGIDKVNADGTGRTIVIVDAFQSPTIQHDLDLFDQVFELPAATREHRRAGRSDAVRPERRQPGRLGRRDHASTSSGRTRSRPAATIKLVLAKSNDDADILSATQFAVDHNLGDVISQSLRRGRAVRRPGDRAGPAPDVREGDGEGHHAARLLRRPGRGPAELRRLDLHQGGQLAGVRPVRDRRRRHPARRRRPHRRLPQRDHVERAAVRGGDRRRVQRQLPDADLPEAAAPASRGACRTWPTTPASTPVCSPSGAPRAWARNLLFIFGGTSAGSPQWAGLPRWPAQLRHARVGYLNPQVYALSLAKPVYSALFHDITTGDNTFHGEAFGDPTIQGFPAATRLGPGDGPRHAEGEHARPGARRQAAVTVGTTR